ncbi:YbbR-like domain-containing protein, partial [Thermodesulfobacteriota bacterium]
LREDPTYCAELPQITEGIVTLPLLPEALRLPEGISAVSVTPTSLTMGIEKETERQTWITVTVSGRPCSGYTVTEATTQPRQVVLRGPSSAVKGIEKAHTKPVDISGVAESFARDISLDIEEPVRAVSLSGPVRVSVTVEREMIERVWKGIPVEPRNASGHCSITPGEIDLKVRGFVHDFPGTERAEVFVDLAALPKGVYVRRATIRLPMEIALVDASPVVFTVEIK